MRILAYISLLCILSACRKKTNMPDEQPLQDSEMINGLPENKKSMNGYLYLSYRDDNLRSIATFCEPSKNLIYMADHRNDYATGLNGNISVGRLSVGGHSLALTSFNPTAVYQLNDYSLTMDTFPTWSGEGNRTFVPFNIKVKRGMPLFAKDSVLLYPISKSNGAVFKIDQIAVNFDSLIVTLTDGFQNSRVITKSLTGADTALVYKPQEFSGYYPGATTAVMNIYAYNYSYKITAGKLYVFELSNKKTNINVVLDD